MDEELSETPFSSDVLHVCEIASERGTREGSFEAVPRAAGPRDRWTLFRLAACHSLRTMFPESWGDQHILSN